MSRPALVLAACALFLPALARAQTTTTTGTLTIQESADPLEATPAINAAECSGGTLDKLTFSWNFTGSGTTLRLDVSDTTGCPQTNTTSSIHTFQGLAPSIPATFPTGQYPATGAAQQILPSDAIAKLVSVGATVDCTTQDRTLYFCVVATDGSQANGQITLQVLAPGPPTGVVAGPADSGALRVSWTAPSSVTVAANYVVTAVPVAGSVPDGGSPDTSTHQTGQVSGTSTTIGGLTNGQDYSITVTPYSTAGNVGKPSQAIIAAPVEVIDFWIAYRDANGHETGGCSTAGGAALLAALGLAALVLRRRS